MSLQIPAGDFRAFIFDCDGTLADNMPLHFKAWRRAMAKFGGDFPEELFYRWGGVPTREIVCMLNERNGTSLHTEDVVRVKERCYLEMISQVQPMPDVVELARAHHGKIPMAVASGGHRDLVEPTLHALGIADVFSVVVAYGDYKNGKPAPDPFLKAAELLGIEPAHCLVFEDSATGIEAARAAGMSCVQV